MNLIVAVDKNWGIGYKGTQPVEIPMDRKFFRETTSGKVVVLGRKTLETFPNGLPLMNRTNIILTENKEFKAKGAIVCHSMEDALEELKNYEDDDIYIIGGESIYRQFLPYCNVAHVTKIDYTYQVDRYFPNLDEMKDWVITADSDELTYFDLEYTFVKYEKLAK